GELRMDEDGPAFDFLDRVLIGRRKGRFLGGEGWGEEDEESESEAFHRLFLVASALADAINTPANLAIPGHHTARDGGRDSRAGNSRRGRKGPGRCIGDSDPKDRRRACQAQDRARQAGAEKATSTSAGRWSSRHSCRS